ncbi:hypothetical protein JHK85_049642 [Glycine max]|nr:hypothetical protein JHK85_049642 [Glycine max]
MAESSACLVRSFSTPAEATCCDGNPIRALGESISFGRFMTEGLDWEKWSTFSHNRYVEEAEKYSKPGSVAAKKAYFEAHYKRAAAERAAALIPEANAQANGTFEAQVHEGNCADSSFGTSSNVANVVAANEQLDNETANYQVVECADTDQHKCDAGQSHLDISNVKGAEDVPHPRTDTDLNVESCTFVANSYSNQLHHVEDNTYIAVPAEEKTPDHGAVGQEVLTLSVKGREANSSPKLSTKTVVAKHSRSLDERKAAVLPRSGINSGPKVKKSVGDSVEKKRLIAQSVRMSINLPSGSGETRKRTATASQSRNGTNNFSTSKKSVRGLVEKKRITAPSLRMSINLPSGAGMTSKTDTVAAKPRNGINFAAKSMKSVGNSVEKRPTKRSLHMSINLPSGAGETSKTASVLEQNGIKKNHSNISKNNPGVLQTSTKFLQRMDETKSKEEEKVKLQRTLKGKTEHDHKKLRQRSGSISKLNEDKPGGSQSPSNQTRKISLTLPQSPKLGRKASSSSSTVQDRSLGNSWKPPISTSKRTAEKNYRTAWRPVTSSSNTTRENASPNIQQ